MYLSTKVYGHEIGLSCCFRQWRAESHCNKLHGYALSVKFIFSATHLDECGWVVDFGGMKDLKELLQRDFDHKTLVAADDPFLSQLWELTKLGVADVIVVPAVGCEKFAELIYMMALGWLIEAGYSPRVKLVSVEVREHGANSAIYTTGLLK